MKQGRHRLLSLGATLVLACAGARAAGDVRFANHDPVAIVNDRCDVPSQPQSFNIGEGFYVLQAEVFRRVPGFIEFESPTRSHSHNSLGEVPDSTWFTNRIGVRDVSLDELGRGPSRSNGPDRSTPWRIIGSKTAGIAIGFRVKDARGDVYLIKFDQRQIPEMESAADVIVQRLVWAAGYNVPENDVVFFAEDQLQLDPKAEIEDQFGNDRHMTEADLKHLLKKVASEPDGRYRALSSRYLPGKSLGGIRPEGTRMSDPNDSIPHELRRELRGLHALYAWVDNRDMKPGNTLDIWVEDPARPDHHYVVHYLIDFGKALGVQRSHMARDRVKPAIRGVAQFDSEFNPGAWKPLHPWIPFESADRFDNYWATKIVMRFRPDQIRAAVEQGRFSDPRAVEHYVRVLLERQRLTARYWFSRVTPLDRFDVKETGGQFELCFDDLWLAYGLGPEVGTTAYRAGTDGTPVAPDAHGHACVPGTAAAADSGYTIVRLTVSRGDEEMPPVDVHLARNDRGRLRVIGIWRH